VGTESTVVTSGENERSRSDESREKHMGGGGLGFRCYKNLVPNKLDGRKKAEGGKEKTPT